LEVFISHIDSDIAAGKRSSPGGVSRLPGSR